MNARARLRALEESLSPTEAVLRWLAEARAFGGFGAYAVATLEVPEGAAPLEQISARVEAAARREHRGASRATLGAAIAGDLEDALFRYELILRLNAATLELVERLRPRLRALVAALANRKADAPVGVAETAQSGTTPTAVDGRSAAWGEQVNELIATVAIEDEARSALEHGYLDGAAALFADVAQGWRTLGAEVHEIASGARRGTRSGPSNSLPRKAQARAGAIAADARLAALLALGEHARATELLRALAADVRTDPWLAVHALERNSRPLAGRTADERSDSATSAAHPLDGLSAAEQARQLRLIATELEPLP
jgi:hypothetical protein